MPFCLGPGSIVLGIASCASLACLFYGIWFYFDVDSMLPALRQQPPSLTMATQFNASPNGRPTPVDKRIDDDGAAKIRSAPKGSCGGSWPPPWRSKWRHDGKCGPNAPGFECPSLEQFESQATNESEMFLKYSPCCSKAGWCGNTSKHCSFKQYEEEVRGQNSSGSSNTISGQKKGKTKGKTKHRKN